MFGVSKGEDGDMALTELVTLVELGFVVDERSVTTFVIFRSLVKWSKFLELPT